MQTEILITAASVLAAIGTIYWHRGGHNIRAGVAMMKKTYEISGGHADPFYSEYDPVAVRQLKDAQQPSKDSILRNYHARKAAERKEQGSPRLILCAVALLAFAAVCALACIWLGP